MSAIPSECTVIGNYSVNSHSEEVVYLMKGEQGTLLNDRKYDCLQKMKDDPHILQGSYCPRTWDNVMCWGDTEPGLTVCQHCPEYINSFTTTHFASRTCLPEGVWRSNPTLNVTSPYGWTNYSACLTPPSYSVHPDPAEDVPSVIVDHIMEMRIMYNIGYGLSLISLILAFFIMVYFRKLHCSRNTIHINLFVSFILRASISLVRDNFMVGNIGFNGDVGISNTTGNMVFTDGTHWECRFFSAVSNYTVACSYMWIFVEAVFLHMVIYVNVFSQKIRVIWYIVIGWSVPLLVVVTWSVMRVIFDNYLCWNTHTRFPGLIWVIQGPIMLTVVFNFLFFISIIRTLYTKLSGTTGSRNKLHRYRRMTKSSLLLIPVFGVYYVVFTIPLHTFGETAAFVMLFVEMFFNSYQGFFIAIVLCFVNQEVRTEIQRAWTKRRLNNGSLLSHSQKQRDSLTNRSNVQQTTRVKESPSIDNDESIPFLKPETRDDDSVNQVPMTDINSTQIPNSNNSCENGKYSGQKPENGVKTDVVIHTGAKESETAIDRKELQLTKCCDNIEVMSSNIV